MERFYKLVDKAVSSKIYLWLLNRLLHFRVPFNAPHGLIITSIKPGQVEVSLPYKRRNLNHLGGIHACALATLCEYVSGLCLTTQLRSGNYRIIMKSMQVDFAYQARMDVIAKAELSLQDADAGIKTPLKTSDAIEFKHEVSVYDKSGNSICNARVIWQFKKWDKVKTR